jgi:serine/threonine protein kinase
MSTTALLDTLAATPLLTPRQREEVVRVLRSQFPEARALAQELLRRGWLTPYQVNRLLQGRGGELQLGPYIVLERLGEGGMGEVFKARHPTMDRLVAVKKIRKDRLATPNAVQRFHQEVRAAARLAHPNVVYALDTFQAGDAHVLVMEYVEGIDLARLVQKSGPLPVAQACEYIRQAALGLQHAHERGLIHRDIKPHNLLVASTTVGGTQFAEPVVKILDMGLARLIDAGEDTTSLTQEGAVMGTPDYIAPEQARHSQSGDIRSDLYSLGCTLYFLLTGWPPFPTGTLAEKLLKHVMEQPEPVERLRPDVPPAVGAVVRRLLAKRPEERFQTPRELAEALAGQHQVQAASLPLSGKLTRVPALPHAKLATALPAETLAEGSAVPISSSLLERSAAFAQATALRRPLWLAGGALAGGACLLVLLLVWFLVRGRTTAPPSPAPAQASLEYVKKLGREETLLATLEANGRPSLQGKWHFIGPFDDLRGAGFHTVYPPEQEIDLSKSYPGKDGKSVAWKEYLNFPLGPRLQSRTFFADTLMSCAYFYCPIESRIVQTLPVRFFQQESLKVWLNGKQLLSLNSPQNLENTAQLDLQPGTNHLLLKIGGRQGWTLAVQPLLPADLEAAFGLRWQLDFLPGQVLEGENLKVVAKSQEFPAAPQDMRAIAGSWWRGSAQLQGQPARVGDWLDLEVFVQFDRRYSVSACLTKAPSHGIIQLDLQGQPLGGRIDLFHPSQTVNSGPIELGTVALKRGVTLLRVQVVGTNERSAGPRYNWGLDCITLR